MIMEGHWVQSVAFDNMEGILDAVGECKWVHAHVSLVHYDIFTTLMSDWLNEVMSHWLIERHVLLRQWVTMVTDS